MKQTIGLLLFTIVLNFSLTAQNFSALEKIKISEANNAFFASYYEEALSIYKSIYNKHTGNAFLNYRIGFCYLEMGDYQDALDYFEEVNAGSLKKKNADYYFVHASTLQRLGRYEEALGKYNEFKQKARGKDLKYYSVDDFISECNYALQSIESPVSVLIENLGDSINSKYHDYHPSLTADGKTFIFTSRREDSKGGVQLVDGHYYEDVYEAKWNPYEEEWGTSKPIEGALNSEEFDANCSVSPDGQSILVYKNISSENKKILAPIGGGDIYLSKVGSTGRWSAPKLVDGINSKAMDGGACYSADGKSIYFISNRLGLKLRYSFLTGFFTPPGKETQGGKDIWVSHQQEDGTWGKPMNLGDVVNTSEDESAVFIHPNGKTLFFGSEGHHDKSMGGFDIFRSDFKDGKWTEPQNLGYPINSFRDEKEIVISTDGKVAWLSAIREEGKKDFDIYEVDLKHYNVLTGESEILSILKGKVVDSSTGLPLKAKLSIQEKDMEKSAILSSGKDGSYFSTFASHKTYVIRIDLKGYKPFVKEVYLNAPKPVKSKKKKKNSSLRREKKKKTTQTHTVELNLELERENPIEVISKDLFKTQIIAFNATEGGYEINDFSKSILEMYARQQIQAPSIVLDISGHFEDVDNANMESKKLADLVINYLKSNGVPENALKVHYMGDSEPISDNDTAIGRSANRRVEIRIVF
tara:strand:+ start:10387 stop:12477 length:2091 start_codon:yes stop_codon:yes gene_type:complete